MAKIPNKTIEFTQNIYKSKTINCKDSFFILNKPFDRKFKCVNVIYNKDVSILLDMPRKTLFLVSWEKENKT